MRELLIHNDKLSVKTIIALALPEIIIGLCGMYNLFEGILYRGQDLNYVANHITELFLAPFITLFVWSFVLKVINPPNKVLDIIIPAAAVALAWIIFRFMLNRTYGIGEQHSFQYIMYFAWPFISYMLFILLATVLQNSFRNKILAYVLATGIQQIASMAWLYLVQPELTSMEFIFTRIPEVIIQFFLTVYVFKLMHLPYKKFTVTQHRKNELQKNIKQALDNNTAKEQLLDALRPQFPDLSPATIIRTISQTASRNDIKRARIINNAIVVLLSITCIPLVILFFTQFPNRVDFTVEGLDLIPTLLSFALLVFICVRLYLLGALVEYQSHAYILLSILAGLGIFLHLTCTMLLRYLSVEFLALNTIGVACNILALVASITLYRRLYGSSKYQGVTTIKT